MKSKDFVGIGIYRSYGESIFIEINRLYKSIKILKLNALNFFLLNFSHNSTSFLRKTTIRAFISSETSNYHSVYLVKMYNLNITTELSPILKFRTVTEKQ